MLRPGLGEVEGVGQNEQDRTPFTLRGPSAGTFGGDDVPVREGVLHIKEPIWGRFHRKMGTRFLEKRATMTLSLGKTPGLCRKKRETEDGRRETVVEATAPRGCFANGGWTPPRFVSRLPRRRRKTDERRPGKRALLRGNKRNNYFPPESPFPSR